MIKCSVCGSHTIDQHRRVSDGTDPTLCDVCFWRERAKLLEQRLAWYVEHDDTNDTDDNQPYLSGKAAAIAALQSMPPVGVRDKPQGGSNIGADVAALFGLEVKVNNEAWGMLSTQTKRLFILDVITLYQADEAKVKVF